MVLLKNELVSINYYRKYDENTTIFKIEYLMNRKVSLLEILLEN